MKKYEVCSSAFDLFRNARAADIFHQYPVEAEVSDISLRGRRSHCAIKLTSSDKQESREEDYTAFLESLVLITAWEGLVKKYVVDVSNHRARQEFPDRVI